MPYIFDFFGDESVRKTTIVYALVGIDSPKVFEAEIELSLIKQKFKGAHSSRIHCKEIFHGDSRKKSAWSHLSPEECADLCGEIAISLKKAGAFFRIGLIDSTNIPSTLDSPSPMSTLQLGQKQLLTFAVQAVLFDFRHTPGFTNIRLWTDPDTTKIDWAGQQRQASIVQHSGFYDNGNSTEPLQIIPQKINDRKPLLLDVADILAYCSVQTHSSETTENKIVFQKIYSLFNPQVFKMDFDPEQEIHTVGK